MTTDYPLTIKDFRTWLESKEENVFVGWQNWCKGCPIFKCLKDKGEDIYYVNLEDSHFLNRGSLNNPDWIKSFIRTMDFPLKPGEMNVSVTAEEALEVLEEVYELSN